MRSGSKVHATLVIKNEGLHMVKTPLQDQCLSGRERIQLVSKKREALFNDITKRWELRLWAMYKTQLKVGLMLEGSWDVLIIPFVTKLLGVEEMPPVAPMKRL